MTENNLAGQESISEILLKRRNDSSKPGHRTDNRHIALVIEGGAMRGVISAGMVAALEELGLRNSFDAVYGSSAGAISGSYFVARQARYGTTIFYENINNRDFIDLRRVFRGKPIVSLEFLLDEVCINQKPLKFDRVLNSDIPVNVVAASLTQKKSVTLSGFQTPSELVEALRASARIPFFAGLPVAYKGDKYLDASIYESIPFRAAMAGNATDIVLLMTRPEGDLRSAPGWLDRNFIAPYLKRFDPELPEHYLDRAHGYAVEIQTVLEHTTPQSSPRMLPVQIPTGADKLSPLETNRGKLVAGAMDGFRAVYRSLGIEAPNLTEIITPV